MCGVEGRDGVDGEILGVHGYVEGVEPLIGEIDMAADAAGVVALQAALQGVAVREGDNAGVPVGVAVVARALEGKVYLGEEDAVMC